MTQTKGVPSLTPKEAWARVESGKIEIFDLRTSAERKRFGWPPGARRVSLMMHAFRPKSAEDGVAYLCQHANRSKMTARKGAPEIAGGFEAWMKSGLPVEQ